MDLTPESLFERHLASQSEGDFEDALAAEIEAFAALLEEHPQHAKELTQLRDAQRSESQGSSGPLIGDHRASEGVTIGDFQLVKKLGRGGMGEVWEAEQVSLSRRIALKLLPAAGSERAQEFFAREARAGGRLNHPGIVSVMGTGEDEGVRWISMELVEGGRTLRDYLDEARAKEELPDQYYPEIAELFAKIAEAMAVAHEAGVIHRDLKPANIMVTGEGEPKVADFGLARVLDEQGLSQSGEVMGTFYYMSPEQVKAARGGVDHRADVFSLGALFYEALVMARPFEGDTTLQIVEKILNYDPQDPKALRSRVPEDLAVICTKALEKDREGRYDSMTELAADLRHHLADEPIQAQPPSTWKRTVKWARRNPTKSVAGAVAAAAFVAISGLAWQLQEKTDEAVANAEEAAKNARQATLNAEEAEDNARQATENEELARANAEAAEESAQLAEEERAKAEQRAAELRQVSDFQAGQLSGVEPGAMGQTIRTLVFDKVREAGERAGRTREELDQEQAALWEQMNTADLTGVGLGVLEEHVFDPALRSIEGLGDQPLVQAKLLQTVATTMRKLGLQERAEAPQEQAANLREQHLGEEHPETLASYREQGALLILRGKIEEAETRLAHVYEVAQRDLGGDHLLTLRTALDLATVRERQTRPFEAKKLLATALDGMQRTLGKEDVYTLRAAGAFGAFLKNMGYSADLEEAERLLREARAGFQSTLGVNSSEYLVATHNLGALFTDLGRGEEAERMLREVSEGTRRTRGDAHPSSLNAYSNLGLWLERTGGHEEAEALHRKAAEGARPSLGLGHPSTRRYLFRLGRNLEKHQSRFAEAEAIYREVLQAQRQHLEQDHQDIIGLSKSLSRVLASQGKQDEAEGLLREILQALTRTQGANHGDTLAALKSLGDHLIAKGQYAEAEELFREPLAKHRDSLGDTNRRTLDLIDGMRKALLGQKKYDEAEPLYLTVLASNQSGFYQESGTETEVLKEVGEMYRVQGKHEESLPYFSKAVELLRGDPLRLGSQKRRGDNNPITHDAINDLGYAYLALGRHDEAEPLLLEALQGRRATLGDQHTATRYSLRHLAYLYMSSGQYVESERYSREVVRLQKEALESDQPEAVNSTSILGLVLYKQGKFDEAEGYITEAVEKTPSGDPWYAERKQLLDDCKAALEDS